MGSSQIYECLLFQNDILSKQVISIWIKEHKGDETITQWLQQTMVKLTIPKIESKTKKEAEKFMLDIFAVMIKAKKLKIGWKPRSKLIDIITSIINNSRLSQGIIKKAKHCRSLFVDKLIGKSSTKSKSISKSKSVFDPSFDEKKDNIRKCTKIKKK